MNGLKIDLKVDQKKKKKKRLTNLTMVADFNVKQF